MKRKRGKIVVLLAVAMFFGVVFFCKTVVATSFDSYSVDGLVKVPTLQDCVQMMGVSEEECQGIISGFSGAASTQVNNEKGQANQNSPALKAAPATGEFGQSENNSRGAGMAASDIESRKQKIEQNFEKIERRVEALIDFFKSQGIETNSLREDLDIFREKKQAVSDEFDAVVDGLSGSGDGSERFDPKLISEKRFTIDSKVREIAEFYKTTLSIDIRKLIKEIQ